MLKWTVETPRAVAEDDRQSVTVEAFTLEDAIIKAEQVLNGCKPVSGRIYTATVRVEVMPKTNLPLRSV